MIEEGKKKVKTPFECCENKMEMQQKAPINSFATT